MMRVAALVILAMATVLAAAPSQAQNTPDYTVDGDHVECSFTSLDQCRQSATGRGASCFANPDPRVAAPAPTAPIVPPQPATKQKR
jgi:hypothetical protein